MLCLCRHDSQTQYFLRLFRSHGQKRNRPPILVNVGIGGTSATPSSAGLLPAMFGVYQVTVTVPQGVAAGNGVPVSITVAGQTSAAVNLIVR